MLSPNGIKTILFDLDGTLRHNQPEGGEVFANYAISLGVSLNKDDRRRGIRWEHYYWAGSPELRTDLQNHGSENSDFWKNYGYRQLIAFGLEAERAAKLAPIINEYMNENYKPVSVVRAETYQVLGQLKEAGFRLGVVSNRERSFQEEMETLGILPFFEFSLAAGEVQSYKPQPEIFEAALKRVDSTPQEAMYVGDNYFADVIGSRRAGLRPVLYDPRGVYPEADCAVIASFDGLPAVLK